MDHLLENAGATTPQHLHGEWNNPSSIVTFASQYRDGLPAEDQDRLLASIKGATVLVVGCSGRDIDVMPLLLRSDPAELHWMHYSGQVAPMVVRLQEKLGRRMTIFRGGVDDVVPGILSPQHVDAWAPGPDRFDEIDRSSRVLAAAAVASDIGNDEAAYALLQPVRMVGKSEITRRKQLARIQSRRGQYPGAIRTLLAPSVKISTLWQSPKLLNELAEALPRAGHPRVAWALNMLLTHVPKSTDSARIRLARQDQLAGRLISSRDSLRALCDRPDAHRSIAVAGLVDAFTALSDSEKMLGDYTHAFEAAEAATELRAYSNPSQRDSAIRSLAEIAHLRGEDLITIPGESAVSIVEVLESICADATSRKDGPLIFWSAGTAADVANKFSNESARKWLLLASEMRPARSQIGDLLVGLISVEIEKCWGSPARAYEMASAITQGDARRTRSKPTASSVISRLTVAGCAVAAEDFEGVGEALDAVIADARLLGMQAVEARGIILRSGLSDIPLGKDTICEWEERGLLWEASAARAQPHLFARMAWPVIL